MSYHGWAKRRANSAVGLSARGCNFRVLATATAKKENNCIRPATDLCSKVERSPQVLCEAELPPSLLDLPRPPRRLYLTGALPQKPMIAIVGTRKATPEAEDFTRALAQQVVAHGFAVASGGAAGIDTAAHEGALAGSGQTLVVAPAGWNEAYPEVNRNLFRQVVSQGGGYLSIVEPNECALRHNFFARNAVLVALSKATVVVQAPFRSGARNSAHVARSIGRPLFVVPSAPWVEIGAGCVLELRLGAQPLGSLRDLLSSLADSGVHGSRDPLQLELRFDTSKTRKPRHSRQICEKSRETVPANNPKLQADGLFDLSPVIAALEAGCNTLDSVCLRSGWNTPKVQSALLRLTLAGCIRMNSAGRIEFVSI